ncbi:MAG TPA: hypothetical protein PKZ07_18905 [Sedimentisphaerales bacterium]|nr:hypothetical protein [Sedimentisphaerales bacterium]
MKVLTGTTSSKKTVLLNVTTVAFTSADTIELETRDLKSFEGVDNFTG